MYAKRLYIGLAIAALAAAAQANVRNGNPLDSSFYWDTAPAVQTALTGAKLYVDNRNPLHPAYARVAGGSGWQTAEASSGDIYRDNNNPLHPSFAR